MMWGLAVAMAALVVVALVLLLWPLLFNRRAAAVSRGALNAAVYRDQLAELARDRAAGTLTEDNFLQSTQELQRRALQDTAEADSPVDAPSVPRPKALLAAVALAVPVCATLLYIWLGNPQAMLAPAEGHNFSAAQVDEMVAKLAARMESNPDDTKGWIMLARSYKALGKLELADKAFSRIGPTLDEDPDLLTDYALVLAERASGDFHGKPQELIDKALKLDPMNQQTLGMAGISAFRRQSYGEAVTYLEKLLPLLQADSEEAKTVSFTIDKAKSLGGISASAAGAAGVAGTGNKSQPVKLAKALEAARPATAATGTGPSVSGNVTLAPPLKAQVTPGDTLFVFARAANGPRIPLAVLRTKVGTLPLAFTLDDSLSMSPQFKLSTVAAGAEVHVEARISKSGDALPRPGDLVGDGGNVKPGAKGLKIVIDHAVP